MDGWERGWGGLTTPTTTTLAHTHPRFGLSVCLGLLGIIINLREVVVVVEY